MSVLFQSFSFVTFAEMGDKTQLLSILLAARFRKFWPIIAGIAVATLANHAATAWLGQIFGSWLDQHMLILVSSLLFIAVGLWALIPDHAPEEKILANSAFIASTIAFFFAEMGDKTQLATLTLGARYAETWQVIIGTTLGMIAANVPAVLFGDNILKNVPMHWIRVSACAMFLAFGVLGLVQWYAS